MSFRSVVTILLVLTTTVTSVNANNSNYLKDLKISNSEILPLPPGKWTLQYKNNFDFCRPERRGQCRDTQGHVLVLTNVADNESPFQAIIVRHTSRGNRNHNTSNCYKREGRTLFDSHKTSENQLLNKCSFGHFNNNYLSNSILRRNHWWWREIREGTQKIPDMGITNIHLEMSLFKSGMRGYQLDIFLKPQDGKVILRNDDLNSWKKRYVEAIAAGVFDRKPAPSMASLAIFQAPTADTTTMAVLPAVTPVLIVEETAEAAKFLTELKISNSEVLPLPPGSWTLQHQNNFEFCPPENRGPQCYSPGQVMVLTNDADAEGPFQAIILRYSNRGDKNFYTGNCYSKNENPFFDGHGTNSKQLFNKCSFGHYNYLHHSNKVLEKHDWWWREIRKGTQKIPDMGSTNIHLEISMFKSGYRGFKLDVFLKPQDEGIVLQHHHLNSWKKRYVEAIAAGVFDRKPAPSMASLAIFQAPTTDTTTMAVLPAVTPVLIVEKEPRQVAQLRPALKLVASASSPDSNGVVTLSITTNSDTASLKINGEEAGGRADGRYSVNRFAKIGSNTFEVTATDRFGNTQKQIISVSRQAADNTVRFASLNPIAVRARSDTNAVAIIIGIQDYSRVPAAEFASNDASVFYDYAIRGLGVRPENIKLLLDQEASDIGILSAFKNWLPLKTRKGKTDVYVFYSGHGLPSDDGSNLYMLPHGVDRQFLDRTAIKQSELIDSLQAVSPRSVTMFMDACYSGQIRTGETLLVSARPIAIQSKASSFPANFNVISASAPDQLASSSPDLKHGVFSYFLMKGMEGEADENKDGNITMTEMLSYLKENVGKKAMSLNRTQQPQLSGDGARVLVGR